MVFDFKKEYKKYYFPKTEPEIIKIPSMNFIAVRGSGNPNEVNGNYAKAIEILYAIAYTLKMSYKGNYEINGFYEYVVPPLEGFWWQEGLKGVDYTCKETFHWISVIRLPNFISQNDFIWAKQEVGMRKKIDCSIAEFLTIEEGLCVQALHIGAYDDEPETVAKMNLFLTEQGYENNFSDRRLHHEIYLSDPRKTKTEKCKTVIRHPVKLLDNLKE